MKKSRFNQCFQTPKYKISPLLNSSVRFFKHKCVKNKHNDSVLGRTILINALYGTAPPKIIAPEATHDTTVEKRSVMLIVEARDVVAAVAFTVSSDIFQINF